MCRAHYELERYNNLISLFDHLVDPLIPYHLQIIIVKCNVLYKQPNKNEFFRIHKTSYSDKRLLEYLKSQMI